MENLENNEVTQQAAIPRGAAPRKKGHPALKGFILGVLVTLIAGAAAFGIYLLIDNDSAVNNASISKLEMLEQQIRSKYYKADEVTEEQLEDGLYKGLISALNDPYSTYYTESEVESLNESLTGTFSGIGAYISLDTTTNYPKIAGIISNSPADASDLQVDDIIYKVDGTDVGGEDLDEVVARVRGDAGTDVTLTVARTGQTDYIDITITRADVDSETVSSQVLDGDVGYLQVTKFESVTTDQFKNELQELYDQNIKALILDLRDNPGGDVDVVTEIAGQIIPKGLVFYMEDRDGNRTEYKSDGKHEIEIPLAVLVNGNSASSSEILTGAIQDSGCGTIYGTQTYGKGVVQTVYSLADGTALKLTIANYYTRDGHDINGVGITPDVEVALDIEMYQETGVDSQLSKVYQDLLDELGVSTDDQTDGQADDQS